MLNLTLDQIIAKTTDLPVLPAATIAVIQETNKQDVSAKLVADHIIKDPSLSMRILRLSNSAFYGLSRHVNTIQDAVVILGLRTVRNLAIVASTYTWMAKPVSGYGLDPDAMWQHALATGVAAKAIAEHTGKSQGDVVFCAGLLHDLGKLALSIWFDGHLRSMIRLAEDQQIPFDAVERSILGYDHADVGGALAVKWHLPSVFASASQFHHRPDDATKDQEVVDCIHVGDYLSMSMGIGLGGDGLVYSLSENSLARLGLVETDLERLIDQFSSKFE